MGTANTIHDDEVFETIAFDPIIQLMRYRFASFETVVEMIYDRLPGKKTDYGKGAQTAVSFTGGYIAGILCAIVSHPADVMVSKLNAVREPGEAFGAAMGRIYKDIGFMGLWNGLPVRIVCIMVAFSE